MKLLPGVMRFHGRDIVRVKMAGPGKMEVQPFYRSTGRNSGMPGKWLPFDGIVPVHIWFDKHRFCHGIQKDDPLYRYGEQHYKEAGAELDRSNIESPDNESGLHAINQWLGVYRTARAIAGGNMSAAMRCQEFQHRSQHER